MTNGHQGVKPATGDVKRAGLENKPNIRNDNSKPLHCYIIARYYSQMNISF
jgi:hypothetical protein